MGYVAIQPAVRGSLHGRMPSRNGEPYPSPTSSESMCGAVCHSTAWNAASAGYPSPSRPRPALSIATPTSTPGSTLDHYAFDPFATLLVHHGPTPQKCDINYQQMLPPSPVSSESQVASPVAAYHATNLGSPFAYEYSMLHGSAERQHPSKSSARNKPMYIHPMPNTPEQHESWSVAAKQEETEDGRQLEQQPALYPRVVSARQPRRRASKKAAKEAAREASQAQEPAPEASTPAGHLCDQCGRIFARRYNWVVHVNNVHNTEKKKPHACVFPHCPMKFVRKTDLTRHEHSVHYRTKQFHCYDCDNSFARKDTLKRHQEDGCPMRKMFPPTKASPKPNAAAETKAPSTPEPRSDQKITPQWAEPSQTLVAPILRPAPSRRSRGSQSPVYPELTPTSDPYHHDPYSYGRSGVTETMEEFAYPSASLSITSEDRAAYYYSSPQLEGSSSNPYLYAPLSSTVYEPSQTQTANDYIKSEFVADEQEYSWE